MNPYDDPMDPNVLKQLDQLKDTPSRDPAARAHGRENFLAAVKAVKKNRVAEPIARTSQRDKSTFVLSLRTATIMFGMLLGLTLLLAFGGSAVTAYAQTALPGDFLYGWKSATEDARVTLTRDHGADAELHLQFAERRIDEIQGLIAQARFEDIDLAAKQYESHIYRALGAVGLLAAEDPVRAEGITRLIFTSLTDYTATLVVLRESVPVGEPQTALDKAANASLIQFIDSEIEFSGLVEAIAEDQWIIGGRVVAIDSQTEFKGSLTTGDLAKVHAIVDADGALTAREIEPAHDDDEPEDEFEFSGFVEAIAPDQWTIGGQLISILPTTDVAAGINLGDYVSVTGQVDKNGSFVAHEIELAEDITNEGDDGEDEDSNERDEKEDDGDDKGEDNDSGGDDNDGGDDSSGDDKGEDDNDSGDDDGSDDDTGGDNNDRDSDDGEDDNDSGGDSGDNDSGDNDSDGGGDDNDSGSEDEDEEDEKLDEEN